MSQDTLEKFTLVHVPIFSPLYIYIYIYIREFSKPFEILVTSSNVRISWLIIRKQDTSYTNYIQVWM